MRLIFNFAAQGTVTHEKQARVGKPGRDLGERGQQIGMAFELEQPRNLADDEMTRFQAELSAERQVVGRVQERFQFEAAENTRVHVRPADSGGEIKPGHRAGGTKKMAGCPRRVLFRSG